MSPVLHTVDSALDAMGRLLVKRAECLQLGLDPAHPYCTSLLRPLVDEVERLHALLTTFHRAGICIEHEEDDVLLETIALLERVCTNRKRRSTDQKSKRPINARNDRK